MKVHFEDQDWDLDFENLDLKQARFLKNQLGLNFRELISGLKTLDPDALTGIYWLMKAQNGKVVDPNRVNFDVFPFFNAITTALTEESENPTQSPLSDSSEANPQT